MRPGPGASATAAKPSWPFPSDDPYRICAAMRAEHPVQWSDDVGAWLVLSRAEALTVLRHPEWSADPGTTRSFSPVSVATVPPWDW
jgi:cytochrome P450